MMRRPPCHSRDRGAAGFHRIHTFATQDAPSRSVSFHMNSLRSHKPTCVAAFLLGALLTLIVATPARAAGPAQLDRIAIVRFTAEPGGRLRQQHAVLHDDGRVSLRAAFMVPRPADTPDWVLGRDLVPLDSWQAYYALGYGALERFELHDGGARVEFGGIPFLLVGPNFEAARADGRLANLSTRGRLSAANDEIIAGFVVEHRPRVVLIRAIGPGLQRFGVSPTAADPFLSVKRNGQTLYFNDNWSSAGEADAIQAAAARVGAFPLEPGSRDAARLIELSPGAYTLHVQPAGPGGGEGEVLLEIYSVPADGL
jgi:hypothetical protein